MFKQSWPQGRWHKKQQDFTKLQQQRDKQLQQSLEIINELLGQDPVVETSIREVLQARRKKF